MTKKTREEKNKENAHYVNNRQFSESVVEYVRHKHDEMEKGKDAPVIPQYVAECFLKICEGLSHKSNFVGYTYREEMVMDAVENCLKAISNYDIDKATRTGKPNGFAYFTQIAWYAFIRRINKEKRQQDIKMKYMTQSGFEEFMIAEGEDAESAAAVRSFVDSLLQRIDDVKDKDKKVDSFEKEEKGRKKRTVYADSDLKDFM